MSIGHVDAGKSTLMGRLLLDLGVVDQRIIKKYKDEAEMSGKSSFAMAWILDQDSEERLRGLTIDVGINKFETEKTSFTILDAPGHRDFIPNMIAGASQADFALLVIDATTGSFESGLKGQTKEHALLVRSMAVQKIIIAVNKLDNVQWSLERYEEIQIQLSAFLTKAGFLCRNIHFIPCSGLLGDNVSQASNNPAASWYKGPTLVDLLDSLEPISHALNKPFRLTISDVFHGGTQYPLSISGRIESGTLQIADNLLVQPSNQKSLIKALELDDKPVDWAVAGQDIVIHLSGIDAHHLKIGDVLCSESHPVLNITEFKLKALAFDFMFPTQVDVHKGRIHTTGRIKDIVGIFNKSSDLDVTKKKPKVVKPGTIALLVVALDHAVPLEISARIVLRYNGVTLAAGILE